MFFFFFKFPSSPSFFLWVGHCFSRWSKMNLKIYYVIDCLIKNLITHFVWLSWEGKKVWHWNFVNWCSIKWGTFLWKCHIENVHQMLVSDPFLILVNKRKQSFHARNSFKNKLFWKTIIKNFQKVDFIFSFVMDKIIKTKDAWN